MSARFLLEFEATGDQEVVNAINQVSDAGKQAATDLEGLQNIEDPFTAITEGAEGAVTPLENIGGATEGLTGIFASAGTSSEDFGGALTSMNDSALAVEGGLTDANTAVGEFGGSADKAGLSTESMGQSTQGAIGAFVGLGGALGSATSLAFRMQDAQLAVDKATLKVSRSTETARKAQLAFNNLLGTATKNTDGIKAANDRLSAAQAHLNELIAAGVTSGPEYAAAQQEVADATAALKKEFVEGGGAAEKFDAAMVKMTNSNTAMVNATKSLEKVQREATKQWYELPFAIAGVTGTLIQSIGSMGKFVPMLKAAKVGVLDLSNALKIMSGVGLGGFAIAIGAAGAAVAVFMGAVIALNKAPYDSIIGKLDQLGKTIGDTFPAAADALISLGDAAGSSLDFLAGYSRGLVKELTGVELQADVTNKSFSELVQLFLKDGTTGYTQINRAIAGYVDAARAQGLTDKEIIELAKKHNEENKKTVQSTDKVAASTVEYGNAADSTMVSVEGVRTAIAYLPGSIDPANKSLVEMGTELGTAAEQMQLVEGGVMSMNAALNESIDANALEARALLEVRDAALQNEEAISANHLAYAQSVDKVADLNAVLTNQKSYQEAVQTAVNNTTAALLEEAIKLEAASQSADSLRDAQLRLDNAFKSGVVSIKEWANGLAEAEQNQKGQVAELANMEAKWSDIPPFVERTVETLKLFGVEAKKGGEAAREAAHMASEAWRDATSEMGSELQGLADIFMKGGEDMQAATDTWFADMESKIGREMTGAEQAASTGIANMIKSTNQAINDWQFGQLLGESIDAGAAELASAFEGMSTTATKGMQEVFNKAAEILRSDVGPQFTDEIAEIMRGAGTTAPQALLDELNALLPPGVKDAATKAGEGVKGAMDPAAANAGQSAALTLSQEFAAAGTHIAAVMAGIEENMKITPPPIDVDITPAANTLVSLVNTINSIKQTKPIPIDVDVKPAANTLVSLVNTMSSIKQSRIPVFDINVAPALAKIKALQSSLGGVKAGKAAGIQINIAPAMASIKKLVTAIAGIKQAKAIAINANITQAVAAANRIRSIVNALPNIKRTITYTYRVVGSRPNPQNISRTITYRYRTVGSRPAQSGMHETLGEDTMIAAHKGERVDISPNSGGKENVVTGGFGGAGSRVIEIISITQLDGKVLTRNVKRHLMEDVGGVA